MAGDNNKLAFIEDESARKAIFKELKDDILDEVKELAQVPDVEAALIIRDPLDSEFVTWPSPMEALKLGVRALGVPETETLSNLDEVIHRVISSGDIDKEALDNMSPIELQELRELVEEKLQRVYALRGSQKAEAEAKKPDEGASTGEPEEKPTPSESSSN